jgi:transposase
MRVKLDEPARTALVEAARRSRLVRQWRRFQAILLLGEGQQPREVAQALGVTAAAVYLWHTHWQHAGLAGLAERPRPGAVRRLDSTGEALLDVLLTQEPTSYGYQTGGWTTALLHTELTKHGYRLSEHTLRRALHRLGLALETTQVRAGPS